MKLRVVELLLVSTLPAMVLAAKGLPDFGLAIATIFAGTLAAGNVETRSNSTTLNFIRSRYPRIATLTGQDYSAI